MSIFRRIFGPLTNQVAPVSQPSAGTEDSPQCLALKASLEPLPSPQLIEITRFFDGNKDLGSIGCNLMEHPGIDVFKNILTGLRQRSDVTAVYAQIAELDPGEGCWPFTDTILVSGTISRDALKQAVSELHPDDIFEYQHSPLPPIERREHDNILAIWWD